MAAVGGEYAGSLGTGGRALRMWHECRPEIGAGAQMVREVAA